MKTKKLDKNTISFKKKLACAYLNSKSKSEVNKARLHFKTAYDIANVLAQKDIFSFLKKELKKIHIGKEGLRKLNKKKDKKFYDKEMLQLNMLEIIFECLLKNQKGLLSMRKMFYKQLPKSKEGKNVNNK